MMVLVENLNLEEGQRLRKTLRYGEEHFINKSNILKEQTKGIMKLIRGKIIGYKIERKKDLGKKQIWYEVEENETIEDCLARMRRDGYMAVGRKEEPIFHLVNGEPTYLRQKIQFKAMDWQESE